MTQEVALLTTSQVARRAFVDPATVRRWVEKGQLKPSVVTPGGHFRFREADVTAALSGSAA